MNDIISAQESFQDIYCMFYKKVYRIAFSITKDVHLAEDVLQETFLKFYQKAEQIEDMEKISGWLSTVAARTAIDFLRKEQKTPCPLDELLISQGGNVEQTAEYEWLKETISQEIRKLKPKYRDILELKLYYDLKEQELAQQLKLSKGTVKTRLHRARRTLKVSLKDAM
jgi:RNA polymerase sigma-70 factor (ECF subfamily)